MDSEGKDLPGECVLKEEGDSTGIVDSEGKDLPEEGDLTGILDSEEKNASKDVTKEATLPAEVLVTGGSGSSEQQSGQESDSIGPEGCQEAAEPTEESNVRSISNEASFRVTCDIAFYLFVLCLLS